MASLFLNVAATSLKQQISKFYHTLN